jgi:hypothetical protein
MNILGEEIDAHDGMSNSEISEAMRHARFLGYESPEGDVFVNIRGQSITITRDDALYLKALLDIYHCKTSGLDNG